MRSFGGRVRIRRKERRCGVSRRGPIAPSTFGSERVEGIQRFRKLFKHEIADFTDQGLGIVSGPRSWVHLL